MDSKDFDYEQLKNENQVLKLKLESKSEALLILSQELQQTTTDRDQSKLLLQQLQLRPTRKQSFNAQSFDEGSSYQKDQSETISGLSTANQILSLQLSECKQKLREADGDIKLLREKIARDRLDSSTESTETFNANERRELIKIIEETNNKLEQSQKDFRQLSDEREEVVCEKDDFKNKFVALNNRINGLLGNNGGSPVDINAVLSDNEYLKERIKSVEEEKRILITNLNKYKDVVDKKRGKGILKLGQQRSNTMIVAQKQVHSMLASLDPVLPTNQTAQTLTDLYSLALNLLESLNDKTTALSHLRKTNRLLGARIAELEGKTRTLENNKGLSCYPDIDDGDDDGDDGGRDEDDGDDDDDDDDDKKRKAFKQQQQQQHGYFNLQPPLQPQKIQQLQQQPQQQLQSQLQPQLQQQPQQPLQQQLQQQLQQPQLQQQNLKQQQQLQPKLQPQQQQLQLQQQPQQQQLQLQQQPQQQQQKKQQQQYSFMCGDGFTQIITNNNNNSNDNKSNNNNNFIKNNRINNNNNNNINNKNSNDNNIVKDDGELMVRELKNPFE